jgi:hypothetical protein
MDVPPKPNPDPFPEDEIDPEELVDIEQSEREIESGQVVDWKELSTRLRRIWLDQVRP